MKLGSPDGAGYKRLTRQRCFVVEAAPSADPLIAAPRVRTHPRSSFAAGNGLGIRCEDVIL